MLMLRIFVQIQTFRRRPFVSSHNFCHPVRNKVLFLSIRDIQQIIVELVKLKKRITSHCITEICKFLSTNHNMAHLCLNSLILIGSRNNSIIKLEDVVSLAMVVELSKPASPLGSGQRRSSLQHHGAGAS